MKTVYLLIVMVMTLLACEKNTDPEPQKGPREINISKTTADLIKTDNDFGITLFKEVNSLDKEADNIFISPTSVAMALAMTYNGADGETKTAMENTLRKQGFTMADINTSYKSLIDALVSVDPKVLLEIANSIWYKENYTVLPEFITVNQDYFDAHVSSLNFNNPGSVDIINGWVNDNTHEKIKEIIKEIPGNAFMYLINAIYFKGVWQYEFDKKNTADGTFRIDDQSTITVPFMKQTTSLRYMTDDMLSMVEMPYGQGNYSMLVLLPKSGFSTEDIVTTLTKDKWDERINSLKENNVELRMPKFTYEYNNLLNEELDAMGMGIAFTDMADFSKINGTGGLCISKVIHKSFVDVNEEGTEAAAVTAVEVILTSVGPQNIPFNVDHPFIFAIREVKTGAIVFIGKVNNPLTKVNGDS